MSLKHAIPWERLLARLNSSGAPRRPRRTTATACDVEGGFLHVAHAALRGSQARVVRQTAHRLELPEGAEAEDPARLGGAILAALRRAGVSPGEVVMGVPRSQVMLRTLDLPPAEREAEIAAMVHLRLSRDLPFPTEEAVIDFQVLPPATNAGPAPQTTSGGPRPLPLTRALTAVVRRKTVDHYQAVAKAAGCKLAALGLRPLATALAVAANHREAATGCVALVSLRPDEVTFDVLVDGAFVFSQLTSGVSPKCSSETIGVSTQYPANESAINAILTAVVRGFHSYESTVNSSPVARFVVTGSTGAEASVAPALTRQFALPASVLGPEPAAREERTSADGAPSPLPAAGLALGALAPSGLPFDFLHPKRPPVVRDTRRARQLAIATGVLAIFLTAAGLRSRWIGERERLRAELQEQVNLGAKHLPAYRQIRNQARTLRDWSAGTRNWLDHLTLLSALLPPSRDLYVTALSTSTRNTLNLSVKVRSGETVDRLTATLRTAGYDVKAPAIMPATDRFGFRFQANLELEVPASITNDLDALVIETRGPAAATVSAAAPTTATAPATAAVPDPTAAAPSPAPTSVSDPPPNARVPDAPPRPPRGPRRRPEGGPRE